MEMVIFDIDGTLADNSHRQHHLYPENGNPKDWDSFFAAQHLDLVRDDVRRVLHMYFENPKVHIALLTGRPEEYRETTERWLFENWIPYHSLTMRPKNNRTDDHILKLNQIIRWQTEGFKIVGVYEDRKRICDAVRELGVTVFQVASGDF